MPDDYPNRIVCLTEETTEMLYLLGEEDRIVGISGYTVRPPRARREKPKVSAFTSAKIDKILDLEPDLVLGFSDLQASIAERLIREGIEVHVFNQRSVAEIYRMVLTLGAMVGCGEKALRWVRDNREQVARIRARAAGDSVKPRIYFEEWNDPLISGIQWVSELIEIAGGEDCFAELSKEKLAKNRIIAEPSEVIKRSPDIILGSWCGRKFRPERLSRRAGWDVIPAVREGRVFEIKSADILQPGPAALTDGLAQIRNRVEDWQASRDSQSC